MYLAEFIEHRRAFVSAFLGMGLGSAFSHYTGSLFGPPLVTEFGWSRSEFALLGTFALVNLLFLPFAGRFVDRFGTRLAAMIGFTVLPLGYLAFTAMTGAIGQYFAIWVVMHIFGVFTTTIVFARIVIEKFDRARGLALSLVLTSAPFFGLIAVPPLAALMEAYGWRAGYVALAVLTVAGGWTSIALMARNSEPTVAERAARRPERGELAELVRNPTLLIFMLAMFLVNVPQSFGTSQLKLIVMDSGHTSAVATWMMSLYAGGVIVGRFLSGLALDRIPAHIVAVAILGLPTIGYVLFATNVTLVALLCLAVGIIGFAQGAESDIGAYLLSRRFSTKNFSFLVALMSGMVGLGNSAGSIVMSATLDAEGSYAPFMLVSGSATLLGAALFFFVGRTGQSVSRRATSTGPVRQARSGQGA